MPWVIMAYLATFIGCNSLRLDSFSHDMEQSFHLQLMSQPDVDFLISLSLFLSLFDYNFMILYIES